MAVKVSITCDVCGSAIYAGSNPSAVRGGEGVGHVEASPPSGKVHGRIEIADAIAHKRTSVQTCSDACTHTAVDKVVKEVFGAAGDRRATTISIQFGPVEGPRQA